MERDSLFIKHIHDAIAAVEKYTAGLERGGFLANELVQDVVVRPGLKRELERGGI